MKIQIEVLDYSPEKGIRLIWESGAILSATLDNDAVILLSNAEGLVSLARHFLTLAQASVPDGSHIHLDSSNAFEGDSCELIIQKENTGTIMGHGSM